MLTQRSLLTKSEVAKMLRISNPTLNKLMKETDMPCTKIGHKYVFSSQLVNDWLLKRSLEKKDVIV
ncbi:helix-turn-helix domain-containing protein [Ruminiclostridium josui]|uniref:helix-turn-helix domain-containing protein n=1 Tax=Ruminiclostridium josui TaxID=1499 RepID=UPI0004674C01|nr:helix-turn-helix domain-containing protein [Ruminiclostridium josui]